jgi:hypothetical protein
MDGAIRDLCSVVENHKIVAVLVVGSNAAARGVAMAAGAAGLPVLWARNDTQAPFYQQVGLFFHFHHVINKRILGGKISEKIGMHAN